VHVHKPLLQRHVEVSYSHVSPFSASEQYKPCVLGHDGSFEHAVSITAKSRRGAQRMGALSAT